MRMTDKQIEDRIIKLENEIAFMKSTEWTSVLGEEAIHDHLVEINAYKNVLSNGEGAKTCSLTLESGQFRNYCKESECERWDDKRKCCSDLSSAQAMWKIAGCLSEMLEEIKK